METDPLADAKELREQVIASRTQPMPDTPIINSASNTNERNYSKYLSPTLITLPLVIVLIVVLASSAHIAVKIIALILVVISIGFYYAERNDINLIKYVSSGMYKTQSIV